MIPKDFWVGFDPETERAIMTPTGPQRIQVPAAVRLLRTLEPTDAELEVGDPFLRRKAIAAELAGNGAVIDTQIDVWGWGAANTYRLRRMYGYTSTPDALGRVQILVPPAVS